MINIRSWYNSIAQISSLHKYHLHKDMNDFCKIIQKIQTVIDIGGGTAPYKSIICAENYFLIDLENRDCSVDIYGDINFLPLKGEQANLIICTEVLEHIENPDKAIIEIHRALKNEGYLILTVPFIMGVHEGVDYYRFTDQLLCKKMQRLGFEILELRKRGGLFSCIGSLLNHLPHFVFKRNRSATQYVWGCVFIFYFILLIPISKILLILDFFDTQKNYTLGYDLLLKRI